MKSTRQKVLQCTALIGTKDVSEWEDQFLRSIEDRVIEQDKGHEGEFDRPVHLSDKQLEVLDRIYGKHFA